MAVWREIKRKLRAVIAPAAFLAVTAFFAWNATQGNRGLVEYAHRQDLLKQAKADLASAQAEKDMWEKRVQGLRTSRLDPDALDERARAMLNLADPADVVVQYSPKDRLF